MPLNFTPFDAYALTLPFALTTFSFLPCRAAARCAFFVGVAVATYVASSNAFVKKRKPPFGFHVVVAPVTVFEWRHATAVPVHPAPMASLTALADGFSTPFARARRSG